ncbi:MAG: ECF-type sigma factor, partial [Blastocatellia bacterium]
INCNGLRWKDSRHFFAIAAQQMRRVLVEEARSRKAQKRGRGMATVLFDEAMMVSRGRDKEWIALDDALERLKQLSERASHVVELRYFGGLTIAETAETLGVSVDTVKRDWNAAKAWLRRELENGGRGDGF